MELKLYSQDLIGWAKLFDIFAANQNQDGKCILSPHISCFGSPFCKGQFDIWLCIWIIPVIVLFRPAAGVDAGGVLEGGGFSRTP